LNSAWFQLLPMSVVYKTMIDMSLHNVQGSFFVFRATDYGLHPCDVII